MIVERRRWRYLRRAGRDRAAERRASGAARCWKLTGDTRGRAALRSRRRASTLPRARSASSATRCSLACREDMLGRVFNGMGEPIDGGPAIIAEEHRDINGLPMNPAARDLPRTSSSRPAFPPLTDLNTLVRGQKLPIFSCSGLPHAALAAQIARQAKVLGDGEQLRRRVRRHRHHLRGIRITSFRSSSRTGAIDRTVVFSNLANDPAVERIATPAYGADRRGVSGV